MTFSYSLRTAVLLLAVAIATIAPLAAASLAADEICTTPDDCCEMCGNDSVRCARGPCSTNIVTIGFFFISMPLHIASFWDVVFTAYGTVPSLIPVILALDLLFVTRTWSRVIAFMLIPVIGAINQGVLVNAFGACDECTRPCGTCLGTKGFPSGHSANAVGFFLWLVLEMRLGAGVHWPQNQKLWVLITSLCVFAPVPFSRVYLGDHTPLQVLVGSINGAVLAAIYFVVVRSGLGPQLDRLTHWLANCHVPIRIANDYYVTATDTDDVELAPLKPTQHATYASS